MLVTQQPAVHLGNNYLDKLHTTRNQSQRTMKQLFDVTRKLVSEQTEIQGISLMDWQEKSWKRTIVLNDRAVQLSTAKAHVYSNSVLCMGRIPDTPASAWKGKIDWFMNSRQCRESDRIEAEPMEFEWKISQDSLHCRFSPTETQCEPEQLSSCHCTTTLYGEKKETKNCVLRDPKL